MQRFGSVIRLRPERRNEYLALHANVWPAVEAALTRANVRNYTIFMHDHPLFGYYEYVGDDHVGDLARIAADPQTQRWWALTNPCQVRLAGTPDGSQWAPLAEVWHLE